MNNGVNNSLGSNNNWYSQVNNLEKNAKTNANPEAKVNSNAKEQPSVSFKGNEQDTFILSTQNQPLPEEQGGKWGLLKSLTVMTAAVAAFKTGKGLNLKGKGLKEALKTVFSKNTLKAFGNNMKFWKWFSSNKINAKTVEKALENPNKLKKLAKLMEKKPQALKHLPDDLKGKIASAVITNGKTVAKVKQKALNVTGATKALSNPKELKAVASKLEANPSYLSKLPTDKQDKIYAAIEKLPKINDSRRVLKK